MDHPENFQFLRLVLREVNLDRDSIRDRFILQQVERLDDEAPVAQGGHATSLPWSGLPDTKARTPLDGLSCLSLMLHAMPLSVRPSCPRGNGR